MIRKNNVRTDRFGTSLAFSLKGAGPKPDQRHAGEVALSLLALACENMAQGKKPLSK